MANTTTEICQGLGCFVRGNLVRVAQLDGSVRPLCEEHFFAAIRAAGMRRRHRRTMRQAQPYRRSMETVAEREARRSRESAPGAFSSSTASHPHSPTEVRS